MTQETSIDPELTAEENVRFACEAYGVPRSERARRVSGLLDFVDLTDVADKTAEEFSGSMQKRLDAATALVHYPPLVFLDEPTTGLDPKARNRLWEIFPARLVRQIRFQHAFSWDYGCIQMRSVVHRVTFQIFEAASPSESRPSRTCRWF
jgi:ABC-type Na+ transport system ATPase subunit NatA